MSKVTSRWHALSRFRARGVWLYATFRPRAGRKLPKELRAENVGGLAGALPLGVRDAGFERLVGRIDTGPIHHGNHVQLFFRGEDVFASVRQAIEGATEEILLETYILKDDVTGRKLLRCLGGAAARGVKEIVKQEAKVGVDVAQIGKEHLPSPGSRLKAFLPVLARSCESLPGP